MAHDSPVIAGYIFRNNLHSVFLLFIMASLLALIGWLMAELQGVVWILVASGILFVSCPRFSAQGLLNTYSAKQILQKDNPQLLAKIECLANCAGLEKTPLVYCCNQSSINSFTMKVGDKSAIVVSSALIENLDHNETLAVLAHEVAHIYQDDIYVMLLADRLSQFTQTLTAIGLILLALAPVLSMQNISVPWFIIVSLLFAHYITGLLQLTLSRNREFSADVIAVQLTKNVEAMVSALKKIEQQNSFWLRNILYTQRYRSVPSLLRTHPCTQDRVRCLLGLDMLSNFGHA